MEEDRPENVQPESSSSAPSEKKVAFPTINRPGGQSANTSSGKKIVKVVIVLLIIGVLGAGGWFLFQEPKIEKSTEPTPTPFEQEEPTPTTVQIKRSEIKIEVLNGSGISGEAAYLQGQLRNLGYETITTGNADKQDYTTTEVTFSSKVPEEVKNEISGKLKDLYKEVSSDTGSLSGKDIQIIVGLRKGQIAKPTPTSTPKVTATPTPKATGTITPTPSISPTPTP